MDLLWVLPLIGVVLLTPAVLSIFDRPVEVFGVPLLFVYLFSAWLVGVILTWHVARLAARENRPEEAAEPAGGEGPAAAEPSPARPGSSRGSAGS